MVHGGGTHHHQQAGSNRSSSQSHQRPGHNRGGSDGHWNRHHYGGGSSSQYHRNHRSYQNDHSYYCDDVPPEDCRGCDQCCACFSGVCCWLACFSPHGAFWAVAAFVFWAILWGFAASYPSEQQLELNVGETWEIKLPPMWSRTSFGIVSTSVDPGIEVYEFSPRLLGQKASCPIPTAPEHLQVLQNDIPITLEGDEYQFDFFHLNAGSTIRADIAQTRGSTNVYLLKGYAALKSLELDDSNDAITNQNFRAKSILKRFSGEGGGGAIIEYEAPDSDFYMLVYDNASANTVKTKLTAHLQIQLTTHSLRESRMVCGAKATIQGCVWNLTTQLDRQRVGNSCIVVKAVSKSVGDDGDNKAIAMDTSQVVMIKLESKVDSVTFLCLASLPLLLGLLWWCRCCLASSSNPSQNDTNSRLPTQEKSSGEPPHSYQSISTTETASGTQPPAANPNYLSSVIERLPVEAQAVIVEDDTSKVRYQNDSYY